MYRNGHALTQAETEALIEDILHIFGSKDELQLYWKTHSSTDIERFSKTKFGLSYHRLRKIVLDEIGITDRTKEDAKLLKQATWSTKSAYTEEEISRMNANREQTCLEKYGVKNVFQSEEIKCKIQGTCLEKYGARNINSLESNKQHKSKLFKSKSAEERNRISEQAKTTCLQKYGVTNAAQSPEIVKKIKSVKMDKYGDPNYNNRDKARVTCLNRYGADSFSQSEDWKSHIKFRRYIVDNEYFDSYPELAVYLYCKENSIDIKRSPIRLSYEFENNTHYCFPDFEIEGKLVEIKGDHLYKKMLIPNSIDNAKLNCLLKHGVEIWTYDTYKFYTKWFEKEGLLKEDFKLR